MMWDWGSPAGYGWGMWLSGALMMVLFWGGLAALVVFVVRSLGGPKQAPTDSAIDTLRRRLAAGEITPDEFDRTRKVLQG